MAYRKIPLIAALCMVFAFPLEAQARRHCTLIVSYPEGKTIEDNGICQTRSSPLSTFEIPLAVMGFDSGILKDAHNPTWPYKAEYKGYQDQQKTTDPMIWQKDSIIWFSQEMTRQLGMKKFQIYVNQFGYGNKDVTGDRGQENGLTHAWLASSLQISPAEQVAFIRKYLDKDLGVSPGAYEMTAAIMPVFTTGNGWTVFGKTGTGIVQQKESGDFPIGWFVGWAQNGKKTIVFAKMTIEDEPVEALGRKTREKFLSELSSQ